MQFAAHKQSFVCSLPVPVFVPRRYRPGDLGAWSGHLAFAYDLVAAIRPSILVELGTHYGESYFTFCQSVVENRLNCLCYAVDHWLGEPHSAFYTEDVFDDVREHNTSHYQNFSYLLRTSFDSALAQFADESIDLLHIDGLHNYQAVAHDFRAWYPKVSPGGFILFHDIAVRHGDFGVWRLWDELSSELSDTFSFHHSFGLGVLRKPGPPLPDIDLLQTLFRSSPDLKTSARRLYEVYASHLENEFSSQPGSASSRKPSTNLTVYTFAREDGYSEERKVIHSVGFGRRHTLKLTLQDGGGAGPLRIDPGDLPCVVEIESISLTDANSSNSLWAASDKVSLDSISCSGSATQLAMPSGFWVFSYGDDPQLFLPPIPETRNPVELTLTLQLHRTLEAVHSVLSGQQEPVSPSVQVFIHSDEGYSEKNSAIQTAKLGRWQTLTFFFPEHIGPNPVRIDPANCPCVIEIAEVSVLSDEGTILWQANTPDQLKRLEYSGSATLSPREDKAILFSNGDDPQFTLPILPRGDQADRVRITLHLDRSISSLMSLASTQAHFYSKEMGPMRLELKDLSAERKLAAFEIAQLASDRNELKHALKRAQNDERTRAATLSASAQALDEARVRLEEEQQIRHGLETSISWRMTKPLRQISRLLKRH